MPEIESAAPAQPAEVTAPVLTPSQQAVADNDFTRFEQLERETSGKPASAQPAAEPPKEPVVAAPAPKADEPKGVSKRQQTINDYERRIAEQDAELARYRTPQPPAAPRSEPRPQAAPVTLQETIARPDIRQAPMAEGDFYAKFPDSGVGDYADYRAAYRYAYNKLDDQRRSIQEQAATSDQARVTKARTGLEDAAKADPAFTAKIAPLLSSLQTREQAIQDGLRPGPEHDFGSALVRSPYAAQLLAHIADYPEVLEQVKALESRSEVLTFFGELQAQFKHTDSKPAAVVPPSPKTVTDAPDPAPTLGTRSTTPADPRAAAIAGGDFLAFERAEHAAAAAQRLHR